MLKSKILLLMVLLSCAVARAYDFADTLPSGQVLYYGYVVGGVEVVHPNDNVSAGWNGYVKPTGALTVPATVSHSGVNYAVVAVGEYAFRACTGLTSVTLADGIATVGNSAFYGCTGITTLALPASVTSIGAGAFSLLSALADVWMWSTLPPTTITTAFYSVALSECTLHVPCGAAAAYAATAPWSTFGSTVEGSCSVHIATAVNDPARGYVTGSGSYVPGTVAALTAVPAEGYSFICWNDGDTLNPRLVQVVTDSLFKAMFFATPAPIIIHDPLYALNVTSDNMQLGVGVGSALLPAGTMVEVCGLPLEGGRFVAWSDGVTDNPRHVTVTEDTTLTALFTLSSVSEVSMPDLTAVVSGRRLTVRCGVGERLRLYDMQGRCHLSQTTTEGSTTLVLPAAGVWLVQAGDGPARRIVTE